MRIFPMRSPEPLWCNKGKNRTQEMQDYQWPLCLFLLLNTFSVHLLNASFPVAHHVSSTVRLHCPGCYRVQQKTYKNSYLGIFGSTLLCSACQRVKHLHKGEQKAKLLHSLQRVSNGMFNCSWVTNSFFFYRN